MPIPEFVADALRQQGERNSNPDYFFWTGESSVKCATAMWQRSLATLFDKAKIVGGHAHRYRDTFACRSKAAASSMMQSRVNGLDPLGSRRTGTPF